MKKIAILIFASLLLTACGDDRAPDGAVVTGSETERSLTFTRTSDPKVFITPLIFKVKDGADDDAHLLTDIEIEFFASPPVFFSDLSGKVLSTPSYIKANTDDRGLAMVVATIGLNGCTGATGEVDKVNKGTVLATVGTASATWTGTLTIQCGTGAGVTP